MEQCSKCKYAAICLSKGVAEFAFMLLEKDPETKAPCTRMELVVDNINRMVTHILSRSGDTASESVFIREAVIATLRAEHAVTDIKLDDDVQKL